MQSQNSPESARELETEVVKWRKNLRQAFQFANRGAVRSLRLQRNLRIHWFAGVVVLAWNLCVRPSTLVVTVSILTISFVMAIELMNTALEHLTDLATKGTYHELAKWTKDAAAGAVLVSSAGAIAVAAFLGFEVWPWHFDLFSWHHAFAAAESLVALIALLAWGIQSLTRNRGQ